VQCEQTAGCTGCTGRAGVCGKSADTAKLQDKLTGALIGLARSVDGSGETPSAETDRAMLAGLFTTITNVNFNNETINEMIDRVHAQRDSLVPGCAVCSDPCARGEDYDMQQVWTANEDIRSLKSLILFGLRGMSAYAWHAMALGYTDRAVNDFFYRALTAISCEDTMDALLPVVMETGEVNLKCMALLDKANTETYGTPVPTTVPLTVEKGPFIVVTGHDLKDLKLLLEQTAGKGVNIYTHGEMLPAHAYPELKKYPQLKGNFGTAWQNQQKEFDGIPAPILYTTNCLMPPRASYKDRVFTTDVVSFPDVVHIGEDKDFTPVIEKALELGGYDEDKAFTGINGGAQVTTGFGHGTVLSVADKVVEAVKAGQISHFFLVAGCDGAKPGRNYYTEFVKQTPADYRGAHSGLRQVSLQRSGSGHRGGSAPHHGHGPVQRRLQRHSGGRGPGRSLQLRRERSAPVLRPFLVRAEGGVHPAHPAAPGHQEHSPGADSARLYLPQRAELPGGKLRHSPHQHA
jgi:hydroxylamine reductase